MGTISNFIQKKLRASSLTEVIAATTILLLVFGIAIATLNNLMVTSVRNDTHSLEIKLEKFVYQFKNNPVQIPFIRQEGNFVYTLHKKEKEGIGFLEFTISDLGTKKKVYKNEIDLETN